VEDAKLERGTYDCVVCADVLEHLADPVTVLKQLRDVATPDATFIVSVPNVAHLAVRALLLCGRFPKMERGILDRTHLQFWTKDTAIAMLADAGLRIEKVSQTGVPMDEVFKGRDGAAWVKGLAGLQHLCVTFAPRLFAMQWIFVARPVNQ
jgi:2-polyprenyl-3-methyl-5-hydroxy-6-metoxy-1,4-benzoquinol methylase